MKEETEVPNNLWKALVISMALMLFISLLLVTAVAIGVFDPKPIGARTVSQNLQSFLIDKDSEPIHWLEEKQPEGDFSIRISAHMAGGESDTGYGLLLGKPGEELILAISPLGYLSFWSQLEENGEIREEVHIPWRTWPHIQMGTDQNEIWLDVEDGRITTIRVNQELIRSSPVLVPGREIGLWSKTYGDPAEISFDSLEIFSDSN